jgi:hypothetical protein
MHDEGLFASFLDWKDQLEKCATCIETRKRLANLGFQARGSSAIHRCGWMLPSCKATQS